MTASREVDPLTPLNHEADSIDASVPARAANGNSKHSVALPEVAGQGDLSDGNAELSTRHEIQMMQQLQRLANERAAEEKRIAADLENGLRQAEVAREKATTQIAEEFERSRELVSKEYEQVSGDARRQYEHQRDAAQREYKGLRSGVESEVSRVAESARNERQQASWETLTVFDALKGRPRERFQETVKQLERLNQEFSVLEHDAIAIMQMRRQWREFPAATASVATDDDADDSASAGDRAEQLVKQATGLVGQVRDEAVALHQQWGTKVFEGGWPFGIFFIVLVAAAVPSAILFQDSIGLAVGVALAVAVVATAGLFAWLWPVARNRSAQQFQKIQQLLTDGRQALRDALEATREREQREAQALVAERDQKLSEVDRKLHKIVGERERWMEDEIGRAGKTFPQLLADLRQKLDETLHQAKQKHSAELAQVTHCRDERQEAYKAEYNQTIKELRAKHEQEWQSLVEKWHRGLSRLHSEVAQLNAACDRLFPKWDETDYNNWPKPEEVSPAIQFGNVTLDLARVKNGLPGDERLRPASTQLQLPALMTLDEHPVLLITADEAGRKQAVEVLQLMMLRMLTAMPPGKVRFTIFDPVGLGENFASFMHLADFDELLIASRIWTDARQIDEQLTRLTTHMETVLQKYLRNEFATIHEYNAQAGEVAEPFQVLVVANFPTNFSEAAARKLVSIATSGPRCGVYTMIMVDRKQKMPANFDLNDLAANAVHLDWVTLTQGRDAASSTSIEPLHEFDVLPSVVENLQSNSTSGAGQGQFRWRYPAFEHLPLLFDRPPSPDRFNEVIRAAGRAAKESMRVEVPFEQVAPPEAEYWTGDCGREFIVPVGRAGARRLQPVRLGRGTSQHVLVCGKTGSGKSTFLHALITNAALIYGPEEVEFYLIDFKKGVEFKTYATHRLPHARVIAIESEREFGLSVLERLDVELRRRGDLFRAAGVQDLPDFRRARPNEIMPRVLLVVDEFQELFVEDDKLAQEANLLLDRLVRQGRAFGIHIMLGSQTLSGAYSLARSTMGQMAVRVALQCSEADANLILNDERNMAARFLSRPGEAIYNDQNGLLAGNHPFQVVWLPESERIGYLKRIEAKQNQNAAVPAGDPRQQAQALAAKRETIVFEGDQPADPTNNAQLREVLAKARAGEFGAISTQTAWLGSAVAIKEPTSATFARHAGSNLLVVGSWEEAALGVLTNAVVALAAQNRPVSLSSDESKEPQKPKLFYVLDGTRPEAPEAGTWQRVVDALPHAADVSGPRDTARVVGEIATELARREAAGEEDAPPIYLVIFNGGRFRDLRRGEDDFSFSMDRDKKPSPDKQWGEILRNGPAWGVHTLLWCDTYNNVSRVLDRMAMREFEMRVAFQMSAADSSSLLDNPAAMRLRQHRGLFASEDLGTLEKFRPYGVPPDAWLAEVATAIGRS